MTKIGVWEARNDPLEPLSWLRIWWPLKISPPKGEKLVLGDTARPSCKPPNGAHSALPGPLAEFGGVGQERERKGKVERGPRTKEKEKRRKGTLTFWPGYASHQTNSSMFPGLCCVCHRRQRAVGIVARHYTDRHNLFAIKNCGDGLQFRAHLISLLRALYIVDVCTEMYPTNNQTAQSV